MGRGTGAQSAPAKGKVLCILGQGSTRACSSTSTLSGTQGTAWTVSEGIQQTQSVFWPRASWIQYEGPTAFWQSFLHTLFLLSLRSLNGRGHIFFFWVLLSSLLQACHRLTHFFPKVPAISLRGIILVSLCQGRNISCAEQTGALKFLAPGEKSQVPLQVSFLD